MNRIYNKKGFLKFNGITTNDYTNIGYDRGHLLAANFMNFDQNAYNNTFWMGNVVAMKPMINRQVWKYLENYEENIALKYGCIYTVIRVIYGDLKIGKISIPIEFIKTISECNGVLIAEFKIQNI